MERSSLFVITALLEAATGLALLVLPSIPLWLLLDVGEPTPETLLVGRVAGAALLAIGTNCWLARNERFGQGGLLAGVLLYDVVAAVLLAYAGLFLKTIGIILWPAVAVHTALGGWCLRCLWNERRATNLSARPLADSLTRPPV
jgi:hypothetical protein